MMGENDKKLIPVSGSTIAVTNSRASSIIDVAVSDSLRQVAKKAEDKSLVQTDLEEKKSTLRLLLERFREEGPGFAQLRYDSYVEEAWAETIGEELDDILAFFEDMRIWFYPPWYDGGESTWNLLQTETELDLSGQGLNAIDLSVYPKLTKLNCSNNNLRYLDLSQNSELSELNCSKNKLTHLDVWHSADLTQLNCSDNNLVYLDISRSSGLVGLDCRNNDLAGLNVGKRPQSANWSFDPDIFVFSSNYLGKNPSLWHEPEYMRPLDNLFEVLSEAAQAKQMVDVNDDYFVEAKIQENITPYYENDLRRLNARFDPKFRDFY